MTIHIPTTLPEYDPDRKTGNLLNSVLVAKASAAMQAVGLNTDYHEDVSDMIANLLHLAHSRSQNPSEVLRAAVGNFLTEIGHDPTS